MSGEPSKKQFDVEGLEVPDFLLKSLNAIGIVEPTPIQKQGIPRVLSGEHVILQAGTGSGKTLAYLLPLLQRVRLERASEGKGVASRTSLVVIAPSPELAVQILRVVEAHKGPGVTCCSLVGSGSLERQKDKLKAHPNVAVGTPGRVLEMIAAKKLRMRDIKTIVLDETDDILAPRNESTLRDVASRPELAPQWVFASATLGRRAEAFIQHVLGKLPERVTAGETRPGGHGILRNASSPLPETIDHRFVVVDAQRKDVELARLLRSARVKRAVVFVNSLPHVGHLYRFLQEQGVACASLSSERDKLQRQHALAALNQGEVRVLLATDASARGLDIADLPFVIHYDAARTSELYVHRSGRTGRAGKSGISVMMVTREEMFLLRRYSKTLGITFSPLHETR